jgi:polyhydroxyalkanoate synthesis regulator phasin
MAEESRRSGIGGLGDGIRTGFGILASLKEAVEETFQEAVDRGDLSPERAKRAMEDAARRLQSTLEDARDRMDVVPRREFDELRAELQALAARLDRLEADRTGGAGQDGPTIIVTE